METIRMCAPRRNAPTRIARYASFGLFVAFCSHPAIATATAATPAPAKLPAGRFSGWADIDATGRLRGFMPDGSANAAVARGIGDELEKTEFFPASNPGGPTATHAYVTGTYVLQEVGEDYLLRVSDVRTGPKLIRLVSPRPIIRLMNGMTPAVSGRVSFTIAANGRPTDIVVEASSHSGGFDHEMHDAVKKWQFDPVSVAVFPAGFRLRQDFSIHLRGMPMPAKLECPSDAPQGVHVLGQTTCLSLIEIELVKSDRLGNAVSVDNPR